MYILRKFLLLCLLLSGNLLTTAVEVAPEASAVDAFPKFEMRGAWVATVWGIDWPATKGVTADVAKKQKRELDALLKGLSDAGLNAVFFQVRPRGDALYRSSFEPWSRHFTGKRGLAPVYDPLEYCVERCHELGMECHAWVNPFLVENSGVLTSLDNKNLWMTNKVKNKEETIFNPALPETRRHICNVVTEIAESYDVDGIVFDDYFYLPEFLPEDSSAADWAQYSRSGTKLSMGDWRRNNINATIKAVYEALSKVKHGKIRFGVSPQGIGGGNGAHSADGIPALARYNVETGDSQYNKIYSDPVEWMLKGYVDYVSPQIYWPTSQPKHPYEGLARWWNDVAAKCSRHCFASIYLSKMLDDNESANLNEALLEVEINRRRATDSTPGTVFYSASYVAGQKNAEFGSKLHSEYFSAPSLVPPMTWKTGAKELKITGLKLKNGRLEWDCLGDSRYVVYAVPKSAQNVDTEDIPARYILGVTYSNSYGLEVNHLSNDYRIAVSAYDRYGNEWKPTFLDSGKPSKKKEKTAPKSAETVKPAETAKSAETAEAVKPVESVESAKAVEPTESVEAKKPVDPVEPAKPVETRKPIVPKKPVETGKPAEGAKPKQSSPNWRDNFRKK